MEFSFVPSGLNDPGGIKKGIPRGKNPNPGYILRGFWMFFGKIF